ncbi:TonB-dependent receptor [bacterium]|nr:TonB-dependent receptor [bacterium]
MRYNLKYSGIIIFLIVFFQSQTIHSNSVKCIIKGKVIDIKTKEPLPGVNIIVEHTTIGTATDRSGDYSITVSPGQVHLLVSMIGYKMERKVLSLEPDQMITVYFELEPTILEMGAVVITGTATPYWMEDMPVRTEVIPRLVIEQKQASNLAEALSFHTGVRVENNCTNCNFTQVRILGMDGKYSQILIDGDPVVSSLAGVYGLEHFPEEMVDQIEIVKGGGSSLYGAGAVAGVINMITRRPMTNQIRIKYLGNATGGKMDQHIGAVAEKVNETGTLGAYVFGSFRKRDPYDYNGDGFSELGDLRNESIGFEWYYKPTENGELLTSFHRIHEERRGGNKFDLPVHEAEIAEWIEHWRSGGTVRWSHRTSPLFDYRFYYSFSFENRKSYYGGLHGNTDQDRLDALNFYGKTDNPLQISGLQANYYLAGHLLTGGIQYTQDRLKDETAAVTAYHIDAVFTNTGLFIQDDMHFGWEEEIQFVAGFRLDKHSELNNWIVSPRINGKFEIREGFVLRGTYTTGFKPPQIYDEDLHLCGIEGDQRIIRNSADLKEERSHFFSGGIQYNGDWGEIPFIFSLTAFWTRLERSFREHFVSKQGNIEFWERVNSGGAEIKGVELDLGVRPWGTIEIRSGLTYKKGYFDTPHEDFKSRHFLRTPNLTGNIRLSFYLTNPLDFYIAGDYIGGADIPHEIAIVGQDDPELILERSGDYLQVDVGLTYKVPLNGSFETKLNMGIRNINNAFQKDLDRGAYRDPAYIYGPVRPRTLYLSLETAF